MGSSSQNITAKELFQMPDDGFRYELVKGELKKMTPAGSKHGMTIANLTAPLTVHVKASNLGIVLGAETGFKIGSEPDTVRATDIAFIRRERIPASGVPEGFWPGAPDLAVEVLSSNDTIYEVEEKVTDWLAAGTRIVWVINPRRRVIHIHRPQRQTQTLTEKDLLEGEDVVPGFCCNVAAVFA